MREDAVEYRVPDDTLLLGDQHGDRYGRHRPTRTFACSTSLASRPRARTAESRYTDIDDPSRSSLDTADDALLPPCTFGSETIVSGGTRRRTVSSALTGSSGDGVIVKSLMP